MGESTGGAPLAASIPVEVTAYFLAVLGAAICRAVASCMVASGISAHGDDAGGSTAIAAVDASSVGIMCIMRGTPGILYAPSGSSSITTGSSQEVSGCGPILYCSTCAASAALVSCTRSLPSLDIPDVNATASSARILCLCPVKFKEEGGELWLTHILEGFLEGLRNVAIGSGRIQDCGGSYWWEQPTNLFDVETICGPIEMSFCDVKALRHGSSAGVYKALPVSICEDTNRRLQAYRVVVHRSDGRAGATTGKHLLYHRHPYVRVCVPLLLTLTYRPVDNHPSSSVAGAAVLLRQGRGGMERGRRAFCCLRCCSLGSTLSITLCQRAEHTVCSISVALSSTVGTFEVEVRREVV